MNDKSNLVCTPTQKTNLSLSQPRYRRRSDLTPIMNSSKSKVVEEKNVLNISERIQFLNREIRECELALTKQDARTTEFMKKIELSSSELDRQFIETRDKLLKSLEKSEQTCQSSMDKSQSQVTNLQEHISDCTKVLSHCGEQSSSLTYHIDRVISYL